jgi:uncharacterized protein involved in copper resistance
MKSLGYSSLACWPLTTHDRLWFRAEGDGADGDVEEAQMHLLYGRQIWF